MGTSVISTKSVLCYAYGIGSDTEVPCSLISDPQGLGSYITFELPLLLDLSPRHAIGGTVVGPGATAGHAQGTCHSHLRGLHKR